MHRYVTFDVTDIYIATRSTVHIQNDSNNDANASYDQLQLPMLHWPIGQISQNKRKVKQDVASSVKVQHPRPLNYLHSLSAN